MSVDTISSHQYRVVSPSGLPVGGTKRGSPRLRSLDGATIGFVWNGVFRGNETMPAIADSLQGRYSDVTIVPHSCFPTLSALGASDQEARLQTIREVLRERGVEAVVVGNACCGGCSASATRLCLTVEDAGIPAVVVAATQFVRLVEQMGEMDGRSLRVAEYPGTLSIEPIDVVMSNLERVTVEQVVSGLTVD
jgi:hypothetical protein